MKVTILFPENPNKGGFPLAPPVLEYLAALTLRHRPDCEVELIDANRTKVDPDALATDLLGISLMTPSAPWGYRFADRVRARGIPVVLGGIHPTALPDEARAHADAVVVGEAESVWGQVLDDAERKCLRGLYHGARLPLDDMPTPAVGTLRGHYPFRGVFTSRGCIHKCSFCSVRKFFGDTVRYRPIDDVVRDVARIPGRIYYNGDDNIWGHDPDRTFALFKSLADGPKKWWFGQGDLLSIERPKGDEMLEVGLPLGAALGVGRLRVRGFACGRLTDHPRSSATRGVGFRSLTESIDTTTSGGWLIFHVFGALGQFKRDLIRERTKAGLAAASVRGRKGGRKPVGSAAGAGTHRQSAERS